METLATFIDTFLTVLGWLMFAIGCGATAASITLIAWVRAHLHKPGDDPFVNPWGDA